LAQIEDPWEVPDEDSSSALSNIVASAVKLAEIDTGL
jgi:hypothetical protein